MLFLLFSVIAAQAQASCEPLPNARFEMPNGAMKGVVVVAHGLNHRPDKMDDIVNPLRAQGYAVLRAVLSGHEGDMEKFKKASREQWRNDLLGAYCAARALADQGKVPLHFVGYSIGALINSDLVESEPDLGVRYDRMVYLAPAVSVKAASHLVKLLGVLGNDFLIPSAANPEYRASCDGAPLAAYIALFDSLKRLEARSFERLKEIPTLILVDPDDELVSYRGLSALTRKAEFRKWRLVTVTNFASTMKGNYHHMIAAEEAVGPHVWKQMTGAMIGHLSGDAPERDHFGNAEACGSGGKSWATPLNWHCRRDWETGCDRKTYVCAPNEE